MLPACIQGVVLNRQNFELVVPTQCARQYGAMLWLHIHGNKKLVAIGALRLICQIGKYDSISLVDDFMMRAL